MEPLIRDERLRKLTFTGSTPVGKALVEQSAEQLLRVSMELGGNAPFLVFADADIDKAVDGAMLAKMRNIGEACTAANRFLVHESVAAEFSAKFAERMAALSIGRGTGDGVGGRPADRRQGPGQGGRAGRGRHGTGRDRGDRRLGHGGPRVLLRTDGAHRRAPRPPGWCARRSSARSHRSARSATDEEAVERANDTEYGLVAYVFTQDLSRTIKVSEALEFGMVGINQGVVSNPAAPFGGVKHSGFGREGGFEGIEEYLETKYVGIAP